jgi:hypothetical protein
MPAIPATWETIDRKIKVQTSLGRNLRTYLKNEREKGCRVAPVVDCLPSQRGPEFKTQYHQKGN